MMHKYFYTMMLVYLQFINVSGKSVPPSEELQSKLPVATESYDLLAELVCSKIFNSNQTAIPECSQNFLYHEPTSMIVPPEIKIRCQQKTSVRFEIAPSKNWQIVVLINDGMDAKFHYITFSLISADTVFDGIDTNQGANSTLWNTVLDDNFVPTAWRKGPMIYPIKDDPNTETKQYKIETQFSNSVTDNFTMTGTFTWQRHTDNDLCFDVFNRCGKIEDYINQTWYEATPQITLHNLQPDDTCTVVVTGHYGFTSFQYSTPSCSGTAKCLLYEPEIPQNVTLEAKEIPYSLAWDVEVKWSKPTVTPDLYNITLEIKEPARSLSMLLLGNATSAVFTYVDSQGMYVVSLDAIKRDYVAHTSRMAFFPYHRNTSWAVIVAGGGVVLSIIGLFAVLLYFRRRKYVPPPRLYLPREIEKRMGGTKKVVEDLWEVQSDRVLLHEQLGEGAFGVVRRATLAPSHTSVAVKMLKDFPTLDDIRSFHAEMELMKSVGGHAHVVSLVGCCSGRRPMIIAEYCSRGDLLSYLRHSWNVIVANRQAKCFNNNIIIDSSDVKSDFLSFNLQNEDSKLVVNKMYDLQGLCDVELTPSDLLSFCRQIASGMKFLAANRVVHRDLAARNVLVTSDKTLKIADFGLSRDVYAENQYRQTGNGRMPVKWMALESLTRRIFTTQSDVWSFGVVVWEVVSVGGSPYSGVAASRLPRLLRSGYRMPQPNNCSKQLYDLMLACWSEHPCNRPTFTELHEQLDELLSTASAGQYLTLELDAEDTPSTKGYKYLDILMRGRRSSSRTKSYERPLKPITNRYTSLPITAAKTQPA